jgi:hypothetical protein
MAEAKISQLANNAIADWSSPSGRVTNSAELFQLILDDERASHPVKEADRPKLVLAEKEMPAPQPKASGLTLGEHISAVLNHPETPASVYNALGDATAELYKGRSITDSAEVCQALIYKFREVEAGKVERLKHLRRAGLEASNTVGLPVQ